MAIFGNLSEMPLPDVLSMIGRSTGRFTIWNTPNEHYYELHIDEGALSALLINHDPIEDVFPLRDRVAELLNLTAGEFEFEDLDGSRLLSHHDLPLEGLLLSGLTAMDEVAAHRAQFPNPQTVFRTRNGKEPWLSGDLQDFWECGGLLLGQGASAEKIAQQTSASIDRVLLCLYKLRMAGVIAPVRAFQYDATALTSWGGASPAASPGDPAPSPNGEHKVADPAEASVKSSGGIGIIRKIMLRLRKNFTS